MKKKLKLISLPMNIIAIIVTFSMLISGTFAWFTDSATSTGNIIKSGNLDVEMYWAEGTENPETVEWIDASTGAIFNNDRWEPGYVEARHIKIANVGSLALKYKIEIIANGEVSDLADVIDVYYVDPATQIANRLDLVNEYKMGSLAGVLASVEATASGSLVAGANHTITIALKMQENAGNEYQNKSIGADFSIKLLATQLSSESDGFNNQYDVDALFPKSYASVSLTSGLEFDGSATIVPKGDTAISASISSELVSDLKDRGVKVLSLVHTTPIVDSENRTVTFESIEFVDENGEIIDLSENEEPIDITLPPQPQLAGMAVSIKHDGVEVAEVVVGEDGAISYQATHFCEVVLEAVVVRSASDAYNLITGIVGESGTVILNDDFNTSDSTKHYNGNREYAVKSAGTDVTLDMNGKKISHDGIYQDGNNTGYTYLFTTAYSAKLTVTGNGEIYSENTEGSSCIFYAQGPSEIVINDGSYHSVRGIPVWAGKNSVVTINGGTFTSSGSNDEELIYSSGGIINIKGGFFHNKGWESRPVNVADANTNTGYIYISGGTFVNFDPSTGGNNPRNILIVEGYKVISEVQENGDIWYTVVPE